MAWSSRIATSSSRSASAVRPSSSCSFCSNLRVRDGTSPSPRGASSRSEILDVAAERGRRLDRRVGEIAEDVQIVERAEGARQILVDEPQRAAQALEADLHEDAGRILDVVLRRLNEARHLAQLGHDTPGALGERGVVEQRLAGEARRQHVGIVLGIALPGAHRLELEEPRADVGLEGRPLEPLDVRQPRRIDGREAPRESTQVADLRRQWPAG